MIGKIHNSAIGILLGCIIVLGASCGTVSNLPGPQTDVQQDQPAVIGEAVSMQASFDLEKISSGWEDWLPEDEDPGDFIDPYTSWLNHHSNVQQGYNTLDLTKNLSKSAGASSFNYGEHDYIGFEPAGNGLQFVEFGIKNVPFGQIIRSIKVDGYMPQHESEGAGFFVAYGNYETGGFQWYGPFARDAQIEVYNLWTDNVNDQNRGYIIIAVSGTEQSSSISGVEVGIMEPNLEVIPEGAEHKAIPNSWLLNEQGHTDWDLLWKRPDFEETGLVWFLIV
jgi:hypothetical protein